MKILVISHSSVVGAYQGKLHELAQMSEVKIDLIIPPRWNECGMLVEAENNRYSSFKTFVIPAYRINYVASYFYNQFKFIRIVKTLMPDLIYVEEEPWSLSAWQAVRAAKKVKAKVVFFTWENLWKKYKFVSERVLSYVLRNSNAAIAGNKDAENILRKRGFDKPIVILPQHGVDIELFKKKNNIPSQVANLNKPLIGFVGRLEYEKGIHLLIEAVSKVSSDCSVIIIGNGSYKQNLISLAKTLHIENRVKFVNSVPNEELPFYLSAMSVLVLPSLTTPTWKEQFGRVLVEAMTCDVPVIGSDSGAIPEVIGDDGLIFKENNLDDLYLKLDRILSFGKIELVKTNMTYQKTKEQYSNEAVGKKLLDYFQFVNY